MAHENSISSQSDCGPYRLIGELFQRIMQIYETIESKHHINGKSMIRTHTRTHSYVYVHEKRISGGMRKNPMDCCTLTVASNQHFVQRMWYWVKEFTICNCIDSTIKIRDRISESDKIVMPALNRIYIRWCWGVLFTIWMKSFISFSPVFTPRRSYSVYRFAVKNNVWRLVCVCFDSTYISFSKLLGAISNGIRPQP